MSVPGTPPFPGWFLEPGSGRERLWTGSAWGPYRPAKPAMSVFAHLGMLVAAVVVPLVLRVSARKDDEFTRHHATEALNRDIYLVALAAPAYVTYMVLNIMNATSTFRQDVDAARNGTEPPPSGSGLSTAGLGVMFLCLLVAGVVWLAGLIIGGLGAMRAGRRQYVRLPLPFRFVKGSLSKAECAARNAETQQIAGLAAQCRVPL